MTSRVATGAWFADRPVPPDAEELLFCLPHAGGGSLAYSAWRDIFPARVAVEPVMLPGRENRIRELPRFDPAELADALARRADRPYSLYGHSMGGVLAHEVVRELARRGERLPRRLVVGASFPPHQECHWSAYWASLNDDALIAELAGLGGIPEAVLRHPRLRQRIARVLRGDIDWLAHYRLTGNERVSIPLVALAGRHDPLAGPDVMGCWRELAGTTFRLHVINGGHLFHLDQPGDVAAVLAPEQGQERRV